MIKANIGANASDFSHTSHSLRRLFEVLATLAILSLALLPGSWAHADDGTDEAHLGPADAALVFSPEELAGQASISPMAYAGRTYWPISDRAKVAAAVKGNGHDFSVWTGTPVYAVRDGVVKASADLVGYESRLSASQQNGYYSYGRYVKISHPDSPGVMVYAHLSTRLVAAGQSVYAGQLIGYSGGTGYSFGPHLHIDWNGTYNAVSWLNQRNPEYPPGTPSAPPKVDNRIPAGGTVTVDTGAPNTTVLGNLTVTEAAGPGYTTAYPCAAGLPRDDAGRVSTSVNNYVTDETTPNATAVKADANGKVCIFTSAAAHLIWDQVSETNALPTQTATRLLDTRESGGLMTSGAVRKISLGAAAANATVYGNLTVTDTQGVGHTAGYPCAKGLPVTKDNVAATSINNFVAGDVTPNFAVIKADARGDICLYTSAPANLIWDHYGSTTNIPAGQAVRLYDTRLSTGKGASVTRVKTGKPNSTVFGNLTVTEPEEAGFTSIYPCTENVPRDANGRPLTSVNNYVAGQTTPNFAAAQADSNGEICIYTSAPAHLVWDQVAASTKVPTHYAERKLDTRTS